MQEALRREIRSTAARAPDDPVKVESASHRHRDDDDSVVLRFHKSERMLHWAIAIPFLVCYVTSLILVTVYNPEPLRPFRDVFSWVHRIAGVCLILLPTFVLIRNHADFKIYLQNIKEAWVWAISDVKWLFLMGLAAISSKISLPEQGKFNAGQKLNFMVVMTTNPLFIFTGIMIWLPGAPLWPWLAHFGLAIIATPFLLGHIYMAAINPATRKSLHGMISGFVDRQYLKHHHGRWYRKTFESESRDHEAPTEIGDPSRFRTQIQCPSCAEGFSVSWGWLLQMISAVDRMLCPDCGKEVNVLAAIKEPQILKWILHQVEGRHLRDPLLMSSPAVSVPESLASNTLLKLRLYTQTS